MSTDAPRSAADPRPGGRPYYIDPDCPDCDTALVLVDAHDPGRHEGPVWHDEWVCPDCEGGVHLDWPADAMDCLVHDAGAFVPLSELDDGSGV